MSPVVIGRAIRALRRRTAWRQVDLGARIRISQSAVSRVERGDLDAVSIATLRAMLAALGADLVLQVRWQGGDLDRLLDRAHAELVERIARRLVALGWEVHVEVSFNRFGERGSVDVLGWHPGTRTALIVEVKSAITGVEETLRRHDTKTRLGPQIVFERIGERPLHVARLLVVPDDSTTRRRIAAHAETFARTFPARGRALARWLGHPDGPMAGILFLRPIRSERKPRAQPRITVASRSIPASIAGSATSP
jgi:transcriptional regulator with XRE-family HTH domain